jgi:hypothetical protein
MAAHLLVTTWVGDADRQTNAAAAFERLLLLLLTEGFWPHARGNSPFCLAPNDVLLFALADYGSVSLVGDATVVAASTSLTEQRVSQVRAYLGDTVRAGADALAYAVVLSQVNIWPEPKACRPDGPPAEAAVCEALDGARHTGAVCALADGVFELLTGAPPPETVSPPDRPGEAAWACQEGPPPAEYGTVPNLLRQYWSVMDFGERLVPVNGSRGGLPTATPAGPIDLVCEAHPSGDLVAVIWADGQPPSAVMGAAAERLRWLRETHARAGQRVRAMVVAIGAEPVALAVPDPSIEVRNLRLVCEPASHPPAAEPRRFTGVLGFSPFSRPLRRPTSPQSESPAPKRDLDFAARCLRVPRSR